MMNGWNFFKLILLLLTLYVSLCAAADAQETLADQLPKSVVELKNYYDVVNYLEKKGILNADTANKEKQLYIEHASKILGQSNLLSVNEFLTWESRQTVVTFSNILAVLAGIIVMISGTVLVTMYVLPLLVNIPMDVWEKIFFGLSFIMMFLNRFSWVIFLGCLGFLAALCFSFNLHHRRRDDQGKVISWTCCIVWTLVTLYQQNHEAAYLAVIALESALGFVLFAGSLWVAVGFQDDKLIPSGTVSSFMLSMLGILLYFFEKVTSLTSPFTRPLIFVGTFVYSIGMLILSSHFYSDKSKNVEWFWLSQVISFVSGLASMFFGALFGIPFIQGIGGTMFVFWLLEKYVELLTWKDNVRVAKNLLGFGLLLYFCASFLHTRPEYFIFHRG